MGHRLPVRFVLPLLSLALLFTAPARASGPDEPVIDAATLTGMETRAAAAEPRDQCFLYTELLHNWTELAGRDMISGDDAAVTLALQHADTDAGKLKNAISHDSKRLKNAEMLLDHSVKRLSDMLRVSRMDEHDRMQAALRHISSVHDDLLAAVFTH